MNTRGIWRVWRRRGFSGLIERTLNRITFSLLVYLFAIVETRFVKTSRDLPSVWKPMSLRCRLATVCNRKKVRDILFTDRQLRQIEITELWMGEKVPSPLLVVRSIVREKEESLSLLMRLTIVRARARAFRDFSSKSEPVGRLAE